MSGAAGRIRTTWLSAGLAGVALLASASAIAQSRSSYFNAVDTDHDGRISLAEFQERMSWAFRQMDRNGDEVLAPGEQLVPNAPTLTLGELHARLAAQFRRQDRNKNGWLSPAEFLAPPA